MNDYFTGKRKSRVACIFPWREKQGISGQSQRDSLAVRVKAEGGYFEKEQNENRRGETAVQVFCAGCGRNSGPDSGSGFSMRYRRIARGRCLCVGAD